MARAVKAEPRAVKAEPRAVKAEPSAAAVSLTAQQPGAYPAQLQARAAVKAEAPNGICPDFSKPGPSQRNDAIDEDGFAGGVEGVQNVEEEAALEGVLEGLKMADAPKADLPAGSMTVTLHDYQKRALGWMKRRENPGSVNAVCGGILADEQGLGKTVQAIALIVLEPPSRADAEAAVSEAQREQNAMGLHPESAQARAARAAGIGIFPAAAGSARNASADGDSAGAGSDGSEGKAEAEGGACESPPRKKAKKGPIQYQPCGRGEDCTCAICKKAKDQQRKAAEREAQRSWRAEMAARKEAKDRASQGPPKGQPLRTKTPGKSEGKLLLPDIMSPDGSVAKRTLVVCPLCVAAQWVDEVREKAPQLRVALYHGPNRARVFSPALLACYDVIVTTYWVLASEFGASPQGSLYRVRWHRCILDEAHLIRNSRTNAAQAAAKIDATRRWCLTGTPIINAATDVHMLFVFLQYAPFDNIETFNRLIRNKIQTVKLRNGNRITPNQARRAEGYRELRTAMRAVTLRRMKSDQYNGQPLVVLPPKVITVSEMQFSEEEEAIYTAFEDKSQLDFKEYVRKGFGANYSHILVLLMRLRQVCIHPWLAQSKEDASRAAEEGSQEEENPNAHPSGLTVERAAELLEKLTGGDAGECPICMDGAQDAVLTACAHGPFCRECIISSLQHQGGDQAEGTCPLCRAELAPAKLFSAAQLQPPAPKDIEEEAAELEAAKGKDDDWALEEERFVSSSKLEAVVRLLEQYREQDEAAGPGAPPTKTIVFSTFTRALDLLERRLRPGNIGFLRLDGRMRLSQRTDTIRAFARDPQARVLLASTKAAGMGLNVTCACRAVILDVWWNGAFEDQAVDRCHRLGQTREVHVSKLIMMRRDPTKETVEQRIMAMQDAKREIAEAALGSEGTSGGARLSLNDLRVLFGIRRRN
ncbi:hypothetical protein WJX75_002756 [Coccomyxa subellipsoidea]|uniref:Uncharacterized protein n=1 Tax=Coccomyxa subellipsoidea TaxID=248742 RepID=A0ABR2YNC3_9CHLO